MFTFYLTFVLEEELGSSEESGKDWSDLEREAAEEDKERGEDRYRDDYSSSKKKKSNRRQSPSPSKNRYRMRCDAKMHMHAFKRVSDFIYYDFVGYIFTYNFTFEYIFM